MQDYRDRIVSNLTMLKVFQDKIACGQQHKSHGKAILDWVGSTDYVLQHANYSGKRTAGTGEWLFECNEFQSWLSGKGRGLLCYGIPGAGKSILSSLVVDYLNQKYPEEPSVGIAYLYCDYMRQHEQNYGNLVAGLLRQLSQVPPVIPIHVKRLYDRHEMRQSHPSVDELSNALEVVVAQFDRVFVIIDALDECHEIARASLVARLSSLQTRCGVCFLVTSRCSDALAGLERYERLEIRAKTADICAYLQESVTLLPDFVTGDTNLLEDVKTQVSNAADGMFLLASFHLKSLIKARSPKAVESILKGLPKGSNAHNMEYDKVMEKIKGQASERRARDVLALITFAKRPLSVFELQHALAVEVGTSKLDPRNSRDTKDIISACAGLVSAEGGVVRLFHYTTQEYLQQRNWFPDAEKSLGKICVAYLSFGVFENGRCRTDEDFEKRLNAYPFYDYAARNWGLHVRTASIEDDEMLLSLLQNENKVLACSQAMLVRKGYTWRGYSQRVPGNVTGLHLAAYFGLSIAMRALLAQGASLTSTDAHGRTPLSWAAENGNEAVVKLLADSGGVDLDCADHLGRTAISWAAMNGHETVVDILLKTGTVDVDSKDADGRTALSWAAGNGHTVVVQSLLNTGSVDPDSTDDAGRTPASWAAEGGFEAILKQLLDTGKLQVDRMDHDGRTLLSRAAESGRDGMVQLLLGTGAVEADSRDKDGRTPISWAAMNGHETVINLLLQTGVVDVDSKDEDGRTALSWAAGNGHTAVIQQLLNTGDVEIDSSDNLGHTSLLWGAENGHKNVVEQLLKTGKANIAMADIKGRTAFLWAARNGHVAVVKFLLETGTCDVDLEDANGRTAFSWAAGDGHVAIVELLLDAGGVDTDSTDHRRRTPLSWAAENGHAAIVQLLLQRGQVHPDSKDKDRRTPLSWAAEYGQTGIVGLLLGTGRVDVCSRDRKGQTPLLLAAAGGYEVVVRQLIGAWKAGANVTDYRGRTPLSCAKERGHDKIVELLERPEFGTQL
ncbi:uncharacterized protein Z518_00897 [Rhinocladiella mackenziei CBS 650.93]|uniref:NACHT domain-containing protein n=1 Tax=Rhinocladiella mackenziei CBS 650.93 TaxID=1442369 RepID=A0A0D2J274_9EURO|nr:uncharacterized protein Z518_00897 [Rhinocladiella mackenziei CBS 650.93]KIX09816.1 hypothetical protein Z518_00897 [Rhinocladiella mackenziei CBS 650.93]